MTTTHTTRRVLAAVAMTLLAALPAHAADPAAKAMKKAGRLAEKSVRQLGVAELKTFKADLKQLLADVTGGGTTPTDALAAAVGGAAEAAAAVSTAAFDGVVGVRDDAVDAALGVEEGDAPTLGPDFQAGGAGVWDDVVLRMHRVLGKVDDGLAKEVAKFAVKLEKASAKAGVDVDVHWDVRRHDVRIDAVPGPESVVADLGSREAALDVPIRQVYIEARIVETTDDFSTHLGIQAFGHATVDVDVETAKGTTSMAGLPVRMSGVAMLSHVVGPSSGGPFRVVVRDEGGGVVDDAGGRPPSTAEPLSVKDILKQARQIMAADRKFFGKDSGQAGKVLKQGAAALCKDHAKGEIGTDVALLGIQQLQRNALGRMNFWRNRAMQNPGAFASSELLNQGADDAAIPDDLAADAPGSLQKHAAAIARKATARVAQYGRTTRLFMDRIVKKALKAGEQVAIATRMGRMQPVGTPAVSTTDGAPVRLLVRPHITAVGSITLEITPVLTQTTTTVTGLTPEFDKTFALTHVTLPDGGTVVLGGLMSSAFDSTFQEQVPFLGDIPLVARLFRSGAEVDAVTDLVVIVTPMLAAEM